MAEVNVPIPDVGIAAFEKLDDYMSNFLLSGSDPKLEPGYPMPVAAGVELARFTVVGLDDNGAIVPAVWSSDADDAIQAIGVVTDPVVGASDGSTSCPVFFAGMFNPAALVWDESFDTMAKKIGAFVGAPTPTRIQIRERG